MTPTLQIPGVLLRQNWKDVPFDAANFYAANGGVWTVGAGDVTNHEYMVIGGVYMVYAVTLGQSDYAAPVTNELRVKLPAGYKVRKTTAGAITAKDGAESLGRYVATEGNDYVSVFKLNPASGWTPGIGTVDVAFVAHLDVEEA